MDLARRVPGHSVSGLLALGSTVLPLTKFATESLTLSEAPTVQRVSFEPLLSSVSEAVTMTADFVTRNWEGTGDTTFNASPDHATVISYEARLRLQGSGTVIDTWNLGKPTPDANGVITVPLAMFFSGRAPGNYTISVAATDSGGTTDSDVSNTFTLPLAFPYGTWERLTVTDAVTPSIV